MEIQVRYRDVRGAEAVAAPHTLRGMPVEEHRPLAVPRAFHGRRAILTNWWAATTGLQVPCGTETQMFAAMLLDFDPSIAFFGASCLEVRWEQGPESGTVRPAFLARTMRGERVVLTHLPTARNGSRALEVMQAAAQAARWSVRPLEVPQGVLRSSLARAALYRHPQYADPPSRHRLLEVFMQPRPLAAGAALAGGPKALSCAWHLLWTGELAFDRQMPLTPASTVSTHRKDPS